MALRAIRRVLTSNKHGDFHKGRMTPKVHTGLQVILFFSLSLHRIQLSIIMKIRTMTLTCMAAIIMSAACRDSQDVASIILDTDIGNDIDDVECLDIISKYVDDGKAELLAVMLSNPGNEVAEATDIYTTWYGLENVPIGVVRDSVFNRPPRYIGAVLDCYDPTWAPAFSRARSGYDSFPDSWKLYRKILSSRPDRSVTVACVGFMTNLAYLLESGPDEFSDLPGLELVARKVKKLVLMAGSFDGDGKLEFNVRQNVPAAQTVLEQWPTDIVISPFELGLNTNYPAQSIGEDFNWTKYHPLKLSYEAYCQMPYDNCMFDPTAALFALEGNISGLFCESERGGVTVADDGLTTFSARANGNCIIMSADSLQRVGLVERFRGILTRIPASQQKWPEREKVKVIIDTDMGNDVDDVMALEIAHRFVDAGKMEILGITLNKEQPMSVEFVDMIDTGCGHPDIPLGIIKDGPKCRDNDFCAQICELRKDDGAPLFARSLDRYDGLPEAHILMRKLLAGEPDHSVVITALGFSTNLARLLETGPDEYSPLCGKDLVARKVITLIHMSGLFVDEPNPEFNTRMDVPSAVKVAKEWPTTITYSPVEVGSRILFPVEEIEANLGYDEPNLLVEAYKRFRTMPYNTKCYDLTAMIYAVTGTGYWFNVSPWGNVNINEVGVTSLEKNPDGTRRHLMVNDEQVDRLRGCFVEILKRKPQ